MGVWRGTLLFADRRGIARMNVEFPNAAGVFDGLEFDSVKASMVALGNAFAAASETRVGHSLTYFQEPVNVAGLPTTVDRNDKLSLVAYLTSLQPNGSPKTWNFQLAAPVEAVINPDGDGADIDDPLLGAIMTAFSTAQGLGLRVSDGDSINFTLGANGLKSGSWISRKGT